MKPDLETIKQDAILKRLHEDVSALAHPRGRMVGSSGHRKARSFIESRMKELELEPYHQDGYRLPYHVLLREFQNLAGLLPGDPAMRPIMLVAHYDTCGRQPGADDNAAAIAILLAVAKKLRTTELSRPILFLFPDAEEPPNFLTRRMGSTQFYRKQLKHELHCSVVLDLVGHDIPVPDLANGLFAFGIESEGRLQTVLTKTRIPVQLDVFGLQTSYVGDLSDYHVLRNAGEPYLFLTCGRWEHYHEKSDTPDKLNYGKMGRIVDYLVDLVDAISDQHLEERTQSDTTDFEIKTMTRMLGGELDRMGLKLETQSDIAQVIQRFHREFHL